MSAHVKITRPDKTRDPFYFLAGERTFTLDHHSQSGWWILREITPKSDMSPIRRWRSDKEFQALLGEAFASVVEMTWNEVKPDENTRGSTSQQS